MCRHDSVSGSGSGSVQGGFLLPAARRAALMTAAFAGCFLLVLLLAKVGVIDSPVGTLDMQQQSAPSPTAVKVEKLTARYGCAAGSLGKDVIPAHAIVQDASGQVRMTSFGEGWGVYMKQGTSQQAGVLLAVCRR